MLTIGHHHRLLSAIPAFHTSATEFSVRRLIPTVEHSPAEYHVGAVTHWF